LADPAPAAALAAAFVRIRPRRPPFSKRLSLGDSFEKEFFFLMPSRKTAPSHAGATSTRPQRAAATKAATAIKSAATTKAAAAAAKPLTKAVSKKRSQTSKAKSIRGPANTKKSKDGEDGVSAAAYAKEFRPVAAALAKRIVSGIESDGNSEVDSQVQTGAAIQMATIALSKKIVAAVDEICNPKASAPKETKQLAAQMAKIIVEAAASKADAPFKAFKTFSFTNMHGEEFQLTVDASGTRYVCPLNLQLVSTDAFSGEFWLVTKPTGKTCTSQAMPFRTTSCSTAPSWIGCAKAGKRQPDAS
jgi:hypothetical protein